MAGSGGWRNEIKLQFALDALALQEDVPITALRGATSG
jgi:hypothetical protein